MISAIRKQVTILLREELFMKRGASGSVGEDLEGQNSPKRLPPATYENFVEACKKGDLEQVEYAISSLATEVIVSNENIACRMAIENGHVAVVNRLLEIKAIEDNAAAADNYALRLAAKNGHLAVVNRLLVIKAVEDNATASNNHALRSAALNGHLVVVNRLLEIETVRNHATALNNEAIRWAALNGHLDVVNRLLEVNAVRDHASGHDLLFNAAQKGHLAVVNRLLEIDVYRKNAAINGNAVLWEAARNGHVAVVNRLLEIDSVRESAAVNSNSALQLAATNGHLAVVRRLLKVDVVRETAIRYLKLNLAADQNVDQQIDVLFKSCAHGYPKLMKSIRNNEAQTLCFAYSSLGRHRQWNALLRQPPMDIVRLIAKMVQASLPPPAAQPEDSTPKKQRVQ